MLGRYQLIKAIFQKAKKTPILKRPLKSLIKNEALLSGDDVQDPVKFENLTVHWTVHMREMQQRGFKASTPVEVQAAMIQHVMTTEMLMMEMCRNNPLYALDLVELPQFPAFYEVSETDILILDRARLGQPMTLQEIRLIDQQGPEVMAAMPPPGQTVNPAILEKRAQRGMQQPPPGAPQDQANPNAQPIPGEQ